MQRSKTPLLWVLTLLATAAHAETVRVSLGDGAFAVMRDGRNVFLECTIPPASAQAYLQKYLADDTRWTTYQGRRAVIIPMNQLEPAAQRSVLLAVYPEDVVDAKGWLHSVASGSENLTSLTEWLTGDPANTAKIMAENRLKGSALLQGQQVLFPLALLRNEMKAPTPERTPAAMGDPEDALIDLSLSLNQLDAAGDELQYGQDRQGSFAEYRLKPGEALYTAVVVRFTDYREPEDVLAACNTVQQRSVIKDVHSMPAGQRVLIPVDMLASRFKPESSPERREYEEVVEEARRLKGQVHSRGLEGVVVVLDPGHGGRDYGAASDQFNLLEDEINYDIACRAKAILETQTRAKVYMTLHDPSTEYVPTSATQFSHDTDELLLTTPRYGGNTDSDVSANLRWATANTIYRRERAKGVDSRKFVFTSFHCDALFNGRVRGTMIYIPGASLRRDETCSGPTYNRYQEVKEGGRCSTTASERRRDEALSRNFAEVLLDELGKKRIRRHQEGDPIRSQIRKSPTKVYVPAVLRNTTIPTKVLIEAANLTNPTDCQRLANPQWRQAFAEAYVAALRRYYDAGTDTASNAGVPAWAEEDELDGAETAKISKPAPSAPRAKAVAAPPQPSKVAPKKSGSAATSNKRSGRVSNPVRK